MDRAKPGIVKGMKLPLTGCLAVGVSLLVSGCVSDQKSALLSGAEPLERVVGPHDPVPPGGGRYQVGKPYTIGGRTYVPREDPSLDQVGLASWYGGDYHHGTRTANGEVYDRSTLTAAHKTMPLPSYARVTNMRNGRSIVVRVNDRGPYIGNRMIDISEKTAEMLDMKRFGIGQVRVQYIGRAGLAGSDPTVLAKTLRGPGINPAADERILVAQADLKPGPRMNIPASAPIMVATAAPPPAAAPAGAAQSSLVAQARAAQTFAAPAAKAPGVAYVPVTDASSFELAGVDARAMRAALVASKPIAKPASNSADVIAAQLPAASGAPMALFPAVSNSGAVATLPNLEAPLPPPGRTSSYAPQGAGAGATFAKIGEGAQLSSLY